MDRNADLLDYTPKQEVVFRAEAGRSRDDWFGKTPLFRVRRLISCWMARSIVARQANEAPPRGEVAVRYAAYGLPEG